MTAAPRRGPVLVHSSDLHLGDEETTRLSGGNPTLLLEAVIAAAARARADAILLAGDIFENNRVPLALVARAGAILAGAGRPVVALPGNHDPLTAAGVWRQKALAGPANVHVIGPGRARRARLSSLELEVWGNAHLDDADMAPLRAPPRRRLPFHVAMAHGHFDPVPDRRRRPRPAWLIGRTEIHATAADYVALGHWNRAVAVGGGAVAAHYSGSPELTGAANLVRLVPGGARVESLALDIGRR